MRLSGNKSAMSFASQIDRLIEKDLRQSLSEARGADNTTVSPIASEWYTFQRTVSFYSHLSPFSLSDSYVIQVFVRVLMWSYLLLCIVWVLWSKKCDRLDASRPSLLLRKGRLQRLQRLLERGTVQLARISCTFLLSSFIKVKPISALLSHLVTMSFLAAKQLR